MVLTKLFKRGLFFDYPGGASLVCYHYNLDLVDENPFAHGPPFKLYGNLYRGRVVELSDIKQFVVGTSATRADIEQAVEWLEDPFPSQPP